MRRSDLLYHIKSFRTFRGLLFHKKIIGRTLFGAVHNTGSSRTILIALMSAKLRDQAKLIKSSFDKLPQKLHCAHSSAQSLSLPFFLNLAAFGCGLVY